MDNIEIAIEKAEYLHWMEECYLYPDEYGSMIILKELTLKAMRGTNE